MSDKFERRSFIGRLSVGLIALIANPIKSIGSTINSENMDDKPIIKIKPLGFQWETSDPFLFCVHHEDKFPKGNLNMGPDCLMTGRHLGDDFIIKDGFRMYHGKTVPGFPGHPHRGFETITVVREGIVDHADSLGAAGRYGNGDVQWMTAGKGVQHSEMFPLLSQDKANPMELFQIWLNLPKKDKMVDAHFKMLWADSIPIIKHKDSNSKNIEIEVIAGVLEKTNAPVPPPDSWASNSENEVAIWNIKLDAGAKYILPKASKGINRTIYFYQGNSVTIANTMIPKYNAIEVKPEFNIEIQNGDSESRFLILQGKPIGEPVIQYGPFVMNTKDEIHQAFEDYHKTGFGGWPWPRPDQVHGRNEGRFALHADGRKEVKS